MQNTINKGLLIFAIQNQMFCVSCKGSLDVDRAVVVGGKGIRDRVLCGKCFEDNKDRILALIKEYGSTPEIIDGRELRKVKAPR